MSDEPREHERARMGEAKGDDEQQALTEWTSEERREKEDERIGTEDVPKLSNPPG